MKKITFVLISVIISLSLASIALATDAGIGIGIDFNTEEFKPLIWMCNSRKVIDDDLEFGRISNPDEELEERSQNYAFEGEQIYWSILVMDKNKIEEVTDVFVSIGPYNDARRLVPYTYYDQNCLDDCSDDYDVCYNGCYVPDYNQACVDACEVQCTVGGQLDQTCFDLCKDTCIIGTVLDPVCVADCQDAKDVCDAGCERTGLRLEQNDLEVECVRTSGPSQIPDSCNARISEEKLKTFDPQTMAYYECTFTVETPDSMYGEYWVTLEVEDSTGLYNYADEVEYWFFNPIIALAIDGYVDFGVVRPGTISYSETILVGNDADPGSGVLLDMFISGTDFYDPSSEGSRCVITNRLKLGDNYAASGASTGNNDCNIGFTDVDDHLCYYASKGAYGTSNDPRADNEGYVGIVYGDAFTRDFYNDAEIIQASPMGAYWGANILSPGAEIALTFKLGLPLPCVGDFTDGDIYFWGEAI